MTYPFYNDDRDYDTFRPKTFYEPVGPLFTPRTFYEPLQPTFTPRTFYEPVKYEPVCYEPPPRIPIMPLQQAQQMPYQHMALVSRPPGML